MIAEVPPFISEKTSKNHKSNAMQKLKVKGLFI
ncbi:LuxR C-terminal-related transcriptional regulator [Gottfriedia endophytica]